ncbi:exopolysaccharide biosynthesis polyprenyl glycosylphosphotransferase [Isoptericola haloaureus]|uniref:Exopolysaccharide biosynthesis polyprenyl glycosylphosphotransferase n=1 Tax=Isoptericola haloaureus TaxID=1542902 RepID=A0ABU7Z4K8_9MICO
MTIAESQKRLPRTWAWVWRSRGPSWRARARVEVWQTGYRHRLMATDVLLVSAACVVALVVRDAVVAAPPSGAATAVLLALVAVAVVGWPVAIALSGGYDPRVLGEGGQELHRIADAALRTFVAAAVLALLVPAPGVQAFALTAFPLGLALLIAGRSAWRARLVRARARGACTTEVVAVGSRRQVERLVDDLHDRPSGYRVVAACVPDGAAAGSYGDVDGPRPAADGPGEGASSPPEVAGVPVLGGLSDVAAVATGTAARAVVVCGSEAVDADDVHRLGWELEPLGVGLMLTAALEGVTRPRITVVPEQSVSLLHVTAPQFAGPKYVAKSLIDRVGAILLILLALPVLVVVAVVVAATSKGPILYPQERVGRDGTMFRMLKFRTMRVGADAEDYLQGRNDADGLLFKRRDDPRVTRTGRVLRRYSLDELPQLFNVLRGQMSLVGPRPPLPHEAAKYEAHVRRRLLVKPGMTGLWQVSGRCDLPWDEAVRLDIFYAENWTPLDDLLVLARTVRAVLSGRGAY